VVLESLACGTPVVAFDCPGCIREIIDNPSLGVLVPAEDVEALAGAIDERLGSVQNTDKSCLLPARFYGATVTRYYESILSA
jgi:glycosyltransferase involved in cell wall biosynthesis